MFPYHFQLVKQVSKIKDLKPDGSFLEHDTLKGQASLSEKVDAKAIFWNKKINELVSNPKPLAKLDRLPCRA